MNNYQELIDRLKSRSVLSLDLNEEAAEAIKQLVKERDAVSAQRNASNRKVEELTDALDNAGMIIERLTTERDAALAALRNAKEDILAFGAHDLDCKFVLSNFEDKCTCWPDQAITKINEVLGE